MKEGFDPNAILFRLALRDALVGCNSVLDVGCGVSAKLRQLGVPNTTGFEGYHPDFEKAKLQKTHDAIVEGDARKLTSYFKPKQFDACIALDVIEHFTKEDGLKLMQDMEKLAMKKVIFFTPKGFLPQRHSADDDLQVHLSGWEPAEMKGYGYEVTGQLGPRSLRGEGHILKRRPAVFWGLVSWFCQVSWTKWHPDQAAAIFCVKPFPATK
ncbi:MAG: class I SAM-dependent methyltransferase [Anaerolineaceae bacterium]|nr:class I SAM-dependent methyltransferase [Formivibrio sp.]MDR3573842.1 class I SAM-dependent methyltransferase [Anaerolineaceae bacterium]